MNVTNLSTLYLIYSLPVFFKAIFLKEFLTIILHITPTFYIFVNNNFLLLLLITFNIFP
jgi:hypothetical protein